MYGPEPVEVRLRFSPQVTRRVKESVWHPTQRIEDCDDGGCILTLRVAMPLEMKPWIRGWGADVEVLGPEGLREALVAEMKTTAERYGWFVCSQAASKPSSTLDDFFGE
jgi:predicted DNA-binding transcriptional regulator YafY